MQHHQQSQDLRNRIGSNRVSPSSLRDLDPYTLQVIQESLAAGPKGQLWQSLPKGGAAQAAMYQSHPIMGSLGSPGNRYVPLPDILSVSQDPTLPVSSSPPIASASSPPEEKGLWKRFKTNLKKKWWHRAKIGVIGGAGLFAMGTILCACHIPIGGLLIVVGIVVIAGSIVYAIMTADEGDDC
jgi:hypothetical protein